MTTGIEAYAGRAAGNAASWLLLKAKHKHELAAAVADARTVMPTALADAAFEELSQDELLHVAAYLASPDFEHLALQMTIAYLVPKDYPRDDIRVLVREQLREGIRGRCGLSAGPLLTVTDAVNDALRAAAREAMKSPRANAFDLTEASHIVAMGARNGRLLARIGPLAEIHEQAQRLRSQVAMMHAELRLPHTGATRQVSWDALYVVPALEAEREQDPPPPELEELPGRSA